MKRKKTGTMKKKGSATTKTNDQTMKELEGHLRKLKNDSNHIGDMIRYLAEAAIAGCQVLVATMKISGTDKTGYVCMIDESRHENHLVIFTSEENMKSAGFEAGERKSLMELILLLQLKGTADGMCFNVATVFSPQDAPNPERVGMMGVVLGEYEIAEVFSLLVSEADRIKEVPGI